MADRKPTSYIGQGRFGLAFDDLGNLILPAGIVNRFGTPVDHPDGITQKSTAASARNRHLGMWIPGAVDTPTVTQGTLSAASQVPSSSRKAYTDAAFSSFGGTIAANGAATAMINKTDGNADQDKAGYVEFNIDAADFETEHWVANATGGFRMWVDQRPVSFAPILLPTVNGLYKVRHVFGTARPRTITLLWDTGGFGGVWLNTALYSIWQNTRTKNGKVVFLGDSWIGGENTGSKVMDWHLYAQHLLGYDDIVTLGQPGTGYQALPGAGRLTYNDQARINMIPTDASLVVVSGSINDIGAGGGQAQTFINASDCFAKIALRVPGIPIIVQGAQFVTQFSAANYDFLDVPIKAAALSSADVVGFISTKNWITGNTGNNSGTPGGVGNADIYLASDGRHLTAAGAQYWAMKSVEAMWPLLATL